MEDINRIAVFTASLSDSVRKGITEIDKSNSDISWLIVQHAPPRKPIKLLGNQWRNLKRNGWRWIPYQLKDIVQRLLLKNNDNVSRSYPGYQFTLKAILDRSNVELLVVDDIHEDSTLAKVRDYNPDLGLSLAAPILKEKLFSIPRFGTLNLHKAKVPDYRGMPPAFWELWNDEKSIGCTVHWMDSGLDTGDVVAKISIAREKFSTLRGLQLSLDEIGIRLMCDAVDNINRDTAQSTPQIPGGKTYRKPTLNQVHHLKKKLDKIQPNNRNSPHQLFKSIYFSGAVAANRLLLNNFLDPRITVILYHRVTDQVRDNLTVGIEQFDRQMGILREHYHVIPIEEVLSSSLTISKTDKPAVCVTFDDGYLDNYVNAVPILLTHGIPAAFFVSTGIINTTDQTFAHDIRRGNERPPVMTWEHLRRMHKLGFTIGSHTVSHIDCATESEDIVRQELNQSIFDINREIGLEDVIFAYPYGGRQHMNSERLELVKKAGYIANLSAYGGVNVGRVDKFNVLRGGLHYEFSDLAFRYRCEGFN